MIVSCRVILPDYRTNGSSNFIGGSPQGKSALPSLVAIDTGSGDEWF